MTSIIDAWFVDHSMGKGKQVVVSGTTSSLTGIIGTGNGYTPYTLPTAGDTIPVDGSTSPVTGLTFVQIMGVFEHATGFDGYEYLTGLPAKTDSKTFSMSLWVNFGVTTIVGYTPVSNQGAFVEYYSSSDTSGAQRFGIYPGMFDTVSDTFPDHGPAIISQGLGYQTAPDMTFPLDSTTNAGWVHLMFSHQVNSNGSSKRTIMYMNDTLLLDDTSTSSPGAFSAMPFSEVGAMTTTAAQVVQASIGTRSNILNPDLAPYHSAPSGDGFYGALAELWMAPGQFIDWTVAANRDKFHVKSLALDYYAPCNLGASGQTPTGTKPAVYLRGGPAQFISNAAANGALLTKNVVGIHDLIAVDDPPAPPV